MSKAFINFCGKDKKSLRKNLTKDHEKTKDFGSKVSLVMKPPDGGWGWVIVVASFMASFLGDGVTYSYGVLATEFIKHFNISRSFVGWMAASLIAITLASGPIVSYFTKKYGFRAVSIAGSIISSVGFAASYFYDSLWFVFFTSSVVTGFGFGLVYLPSVVIVNVWFDKKRPLALGIAVCGSGLGTFVMSPLMEYLIVRFNWQTCMLIVGVILLLIVPCSLTYTNVEYEEVECIEGVKTQYENKDTKKDGEKCNVNMEKISTKSKGFSENKEIKLKSNFEFLKNPLFILFSLSTLLTSIGFDSPYLFAKDRAVQEGIGSGKGSFIISCIGLGNCVGRVFFGFLASHRFINRFHLYNISLMLCGVLLISSWGLKAYVFILANALAFGVLTGTFITLSSIILVDLFGLENLNIAFGLSCIFQSVAVMVGSPLIGLIYDKTLSYNIAYTVCGISMFLSGAILYLAYCSSEFRKIKF